MAGENFCLKWNDHHNVFFSNIESLCEKSFLTDVILSAGGQMYPAHKLVLCICSTYFQVCNSYAIPLCLACCCNVLIYCSITCLKCRRHKIKFILLFQELFFKPQPAMQHNNTVIYLKVRVPSVTRV